jgi:hypothetical protein
MNMDWSPNLIIQCLLPIFVLAVMDADGVIYVEICSGDFERWEEGVCGDSESKV